MATSEGEVSNCVSNLIHAFTDGLNVFKRLSERHRRRKSKQKERRQAQSSAELQLSDSLRKGPLELRAKYDSCYSEEGDKFAKGDAIAHASLAETLLKLNTGLVRIIAAFLRQDAKSANVQLDYKSLTNLSDLSRREALESLNQLYQRLSQTQLQLERVPRSKPETEKKRRSGSRQRSQGHTVTRVPMKSSTQTQLAMVRPRTARKGSLSSSGSSKSPSTAVSSPCTTPPRSPPPPPPPVYSPKDPYPTPKVHTGKGTKGSTRKRTGSLEGSARPATCPPSKRDKAVPIIKLSIDQSRTDLPVSPTTSPPPPTSVARRRIDKATPSTYTFASDSTKLGEIPQRNWMVPWDFAEAERANAEVAVKGYPLAAVAPEPKVKSRKGLLSFLKK